MAEADLQNSSELSVLLNATLPASWPPPLNDENSKRWLVDLLAAHPGAVGWAMWYFILDDGARTVIGNGGFKGEPVNGLVEIGYSIVPEFQKLGYATEAVGELIAWAFRHEDVHRIIAETFPSFEPSKALLRKLGFRLTDGASEPSLVRLQILKAQP